MIVNSGGMKEFDFHPSLVGRVLLWPSIFAFGGGNPSSTMTPTCICTCGSLMAANVATPFYKDKQKHK